MKKINHVSRCPWVPNNDSIMILYHDKEWGVPVHNDRKHFEMLTLEGAQAGLSWRTVLQKRNNYRKAFYNFDVKRISGMKHKDVKRLLANPGIIRNRLKVKSTIANAGAFLKVQKEFGSFDKFIWSFTNGKVINNKPRSLKDYHARTELSDLISKTLKKRGFRFVGTTIVYAYLQAVGIVNDHSTTCFRKRKTNY